MALENEAVAASVEDAVGDRTRTLVLVATILASALAFIDASVVTIALPDIQRSLGASFPELQWVQNAYALMLGALILVTGGLGDRIGRRRVFTTGIAIFTAASLLCALADSAGVLIGARALQGIGAALLVPQSLAIISATFPRPVRGRAIGTWAAASAITTSLGPPLGGVLIDTLSWRAAFWINLPLAAIALWLAFRSVPESRDEAAAGQLDWLGSLVAIVSFGALTLGLTAFAEGVPRDAGPYAAISGGLLGIGLFVWIETRVRNPVMPPGLFRSPTFAGANLMTVFLYGCLAGVLFLLPFELIARRGLSAAEAGLTLMPVGIAIGIFSRFTGSLADRTGPEPFLVSGSILVGIGCAGFALALPGWWLGAGLPIVLVALGMALVVSPLTTAVMNAVPTSRSGAASGISNAASRIAGLLAVAILGAITSFLYLAQVDEPGARFGVLPSPGSAARPAAEAAFTAAYSTAMWVAAAWAALAVLAVLALMRRQQPAAADGSG